MRNDAIDTKPIDIDWSEAGWVDFGEGGRCEVVFPTAEDLETVEGVPGQECRECGFVEGSDDEEREWIANAEGDWCAECGDAWMEEEREQNPDWLFPMMNYAYPIPRLEDTGAAQAKLLGTCLTVVEIDGVPHLALTGGGMDLSWEICEAYISLDYLPPVHFARNLPRMAGRGESDSDKRVIQICRDACKIMQTWTEPADVWRA